VTERDVLRFYSPYPPTLSGVSDYSLAIAKYLARDTDVLSIVKTSQEKDFLKGQALEAELIEDCTTESGLSLYQIGNSNAHDYVFNAALRTPGIVVLHDLHLHGLIKAATLAHHEEDRYRSLMTSEGPSEQLVAERTLMGDFSPLYSAFVEGYRQLVKASLCVIVHSDWGANCIRRDNFDVPVHVIPHFCDGLIADPERSSRIQKTRQQLGISDTAFVLSHFGFVTEVKQLDLLIKISLLLQERLEIHLLIAGGGSRELLVSQESLLSAVKHKTIVGHVPDQMLNDSILASNLVSILRYPSNGETSGIGARCLSMGRPMLCFDYYAYSDLPRDVAVHIPLDTFNPKTAVEKIWPVISAPDFLAKRETAALRLAAGEMHISRVAASYKDVIASCRTNRRHSIKAMA
jgi:glycosyltransferase involved in cell wall biosynthesis